MQIASTLEIEETGALIEELNKRFDAFILIYEESLKNNNPLARKKCIMDVVWKGSVPRATGLMEYGKKYMQVQLEEMFND